MGKKQKFKPKSERQFTGNSFASKVGGNVLGTGNKQKKYNPFELHLNRVKYEVIGRKTKEDRGLPGIAKAKANKKREKTLLEEYKQRHKSNVFVDRRIGENDSTMDPEKKIALRMALEHKRQLSKKSLFNLNDDEELTHGGLALDDDNIKDHIDSDDEDDQSGMLDSTFVKDQHFGGGFLTRKEDGTKKDDKPKTKKEWIDEIIADSKIKKQKSKEEKEEQRDAVRNLDKDLTNFMMIMASHQLTDEDKEQSRKNCEYRDYDMLFRELGFDRAGKAKAVDKLKTSGEIAKGEAEKLKKLETDRLRRMKGEEVESKAKTYSADDLDDGFKLGKDDRFHVSYKDGKMLTKEEEKEASEDGGKDEEGNESDEDGDEEGEDNFKEGENDGEDNEDDEDNDDDDDDDDDDSDKYSDILDSEDDTEETKENNKTEIKEKKIDKTKQNEMMEAAKKEIPYTFEVPQEYEAFWALLEGRSPSEVGIILERTVSCNHPSLGGKNKEKCDTLFAYLLQTLYAISGFDGDSPVEGVSGLLYINTLIPALYKLTQVSPNNAASALTTVLDEKYEEFCKRKVKRYPGADTMLFLKLSGLLFPATDFLHPVMTPVVTFLSHLLGQAKISSKREVNAALFCASLLYEYVSISGRFVPELSNVLNGLLFLALPGKDKRALPHNPPFKPVGPTTTLLTLTEPVAEFENFKFTLSSLNDEDDNEMSGSFKVKVIQESLQLLKNLATCWSDLPSIRAIMAPTKSLLDELPLDKYPVSIKSEVETLRSTIAGLRTEGPPLLKKEGAPKALKMYEPAIEKIIEGVKKRNGTKEYQEKQKLVHKLKRERKGAAREIKRDTQFLARKQLEERLKGDAERKRKMTTIMGGLASQEGDWNKMKRQKNA